MEITINIILITGTITVFVWTVLYLADVKRMARQARAIIAFDRLRCRVWKELSAHYDALSPECRGTMSREEVSAAKSLLRLLERAPLYYERRGDVMFSFHGVRQMVEQDLAHYQEVRDEVRERLAEVSSGTKIAALYDEFERAAAEAFLAYTPFIRTEIILRLLLGDIAKQVDKIRRELPPGKFA